MIEKKCRGKTKTYREMQYGTDNMLLRDFHSNAMEK